MMPHCVHFYLTVGTLEAAIPIHRVSNLLHHFHLQPPWKERRKTEEHGNNKPKKINLLNRFLPRENSLQATNPDVISLLRRNVVI